jgi:cytochrome P450
MTQQVDSEPQGATGPGSGKVIELKSFEDVREAWRCPHLSSDLQGPGEEHYHQGTVMRLDGKEHLQRRRTMGMLLHRRGHQYFRDRWLFPTADAALERLRAQPDADGYARSELVSWSRGVNMQLAAALTGYDDATTPVGSAELFELLMNMIRGRPGALQVTLHGFDPDTPAARAGLEARRAIIDRFHKPALDRRISLVARVRAGEMAEEELPQDLLTLIALRVDPAWEDAALAEREAIFLLGAGVHTTSSTLVWTLRELFEWIEGHPEDRERFTDDGFLLRAAEETMRLHPVTAGFARLARAEVTLAGGTVVPEGTIAVLRSGPASVAPEVYGADADRFNPNREVPPGVYRFGFAFGTGPHMCYGMPIVMGAEGLDGSLVYLLKTLLRAGLRPDPDKPQMSLEGTRGDYTLAGRDGEYHVIFPAPQQ